MEWKIDDLKCWICGGQENLTDHHTLPRHWKPRNNIIVPICRKCHDKLNAEDLASMVQFAYRIEQELGRQVGMWGHFRSVLSKYTTMQDSFFNAMKDDIK